MEEMPKTFSDDAAIPTDGKKFSKGRARLLGIAIFLFGILALGYGVQLVRQAQASMDWPTAEGVIILSKTTSRHRLRGGRLTEADIRYAFTVDGHEWRGHTVRFGQTFAGGFSGRRAAQQRVQRYPRGRSVAVHYDPADPNQSVLEPGLHWKAWVPCGMGLLFTVIGGMLFAVSRSMPPPSFPPRDSHSFPRP